jgi:hypothetical protein
MNQNNEMPIVVDNGKDGWSWVCGTCQEGGSGYELPSHAGTVALAHHERHEFQQQYAATTAE